MHKAYLLNDTLFAYARMKQNLRQSWTNSSRVHEYFFQKKKTTHTLDLQQLLQCQSNLFIEVSINAHEAYLLNEEKLPTDLTGSKEKSHVISVRKATYT